MLPNVRGGFIYLCELVLASVFAFLSSGVSICQTREKTALRALFKVF
jgi:hypothetical protein